MSSDLYYTKYLKYKAKYIQLKFNQSGGGPTWMRFASYMADNDYVKAKSQFENTKEFKSLETGLKKMMNTVDENGHIAIMNTQGEKEFVKVEKLDYDMPKLQKLIEGDEKSLTKMDDKYMELLEEEQFAHFTPEIKKIMAWAYNRYLNLGKEAMEKAEEAMKKAEEAAASI